MPNKKMISLAFPAALLDEIDRQAETEYTTRSEYIRQTMSQTIRKAEEAENTKLLALSDELAADAKAAGYVSDTDFARLAKEIRQKRKERYKRFAT